MKQFYYEKLYQIKSLDTNLNAIVHLENHLGNVTKLVKYS